MDLILKLFLLLRGKKIKIKKAYRDGIHKTKLLDVYQKVHPYTVKRTHSVSNSQTSSPLTSCT
jgi:hypothetical protein